MNEIQLALYMAVHRWAAGRVMTRRERDYVRLVKLTLQS